ncbi:MAG: alkaline phosphatase D family protein [Planctomycetota bacterium]
MDMNKTLRQLTQLVLILGILSQHLAEADEPIISHISFGSCAKQDRPQPIWDAVVDGKPQMFLFLGDNIYGDTRDMAVLEQKYRLLGAQPGFARLKQTCPIYATWDDHDLGANDAGAEYPFRRESQKLMLDFFEVPADDARRQRDGIYWSDVFGPAGRQVQIILLDTRFFRSPLKKGFDSREPGEGFRGVYVPNTDPDVTVLGDAQWKWLEEQLRVPAEFRIIGSSFQVLSDRHGWEMWGNFPAERARLFRLLKSSGAGGVVLLSGDRHLSEIAALDRSDSDSIGYPLYEVTSSSLNQPSGNVTKAGVRFANEVNPYRVGLTYFDVNYGNLRIDWTSDDPVIRLQICDEKGTVVLQQRSTLSALQPNSG